MKYHLFKAGFEVMKTDHAAMADRKVAQGWELIDSKESEKLPESNVINTTAKKMGRPPKAIANAI